MRRLVCLAVALLLVAALLPGTVLALNNTADTAIVLTAQNAGHADRLVGDSGGAVRFYRIDYAGAARPVKVELTASPGRDSSGGAFGFKIYGPEGLIGEAPVEYNEPTWTRFSMTLASTTPGVYLIQVYNYTNGMAVDFNILVSGLAEATAQTPSASPASSTPDQPLAISQTSLSIGGSLVGQSGGSQQYFSLDYPGAGASMTAELRYSPPSPFDNGAVGFNIYRGDKLLGQSSQTQRDGSGATVTFTLMDDAGGELLLQVFNYEPGFRANYVLYVTGAAGQVLQPTDNTVSGKATVLNSAASAARGSIGPGAEATFNFFLVTHPGNNKDVTVRLTVDAADGIDDQMVGFNLYKGPDLAGHAVANLTSKGDKRVASLTITEGSAVTYGIQVFNYSTRAPARYSIYVAGLQ